MNGLTDPTYKYADYISSSTPMTVNWNVGSIADGQYAMIAGGSEINAGVAVFRTSTLIVGLNATGDQVLKGTAGDDDVVGGGFVDFAQLGSGDDFVMLGTGDDAATGGAGDDVLDGGTGADELIGGIGNDMYYVDTMLDVVVEMSGQGADVVVTRGSYALAAGTSIEELRTSSQGSTAALSLTGNELDNVITGNNGSNTLSGGAGNDTLDGLGGIDTASYADATSSVAVGLASTGVQDTGGAGLDRLTRIENLVGSAFADTLTGSAGNNQLFGNDGSDVLNGGKGFDRLDGGAGSDTLNGGADDDVLIVDGLGDVVIETASGGIADRIMARASYKLDTGVHVEFLTTTSSTSTTALALVGNEFSQEIVGNYGTNTLRDGAGVADLLRGLSGNDVYQVYNSATTIQEGVAQGASDRVAAGVDYALGAGVHVETMTTNGATGTSDISLTGNEFAQTIIGNAGDNRIDGGGSVDTLQGLDGADTFAFTTTPGLGNVDTILDFDAAADKIEFDDVVFTALTTLGTLASGQFRANLTGLSQDADDFIIYETDTGKLFYDANASAGGPGVHFATIAVGLSLANNNFIVL
ncbi:calcium-binding protein [Mesorhizobium sp. IMUNJ 23232]|uniref:calcium-binding protein n=1 Tax=Mesorhizobium sp. IMUNJ 23232 TaxID=3376064 RepID=UPI0037946E7B